MRSPVPYRHSVRIRFKASGGVTLRPVSSPTRNSSRRKFFTCSVSLPHFLALRAQPRGTPLELLAVEVLEVLWVSGIFAFREENFAAHWLYTTRRNVVPVATVALFSIFRLHCSFIDNCNHGQTISNLFAWRINVAILPSLTYLSTCALSGAIFRSHTSLPLFASLKLWSFNTSP